MFNLSSAEGARFAAVCEEMTEAVQALGPSPLRKERSALSGQPSAAAEGLEAES
jgi:hypothetical protein